MRITEIDFGGARPVEGYGPGFFRIGGEKIEGSLALLPAGAESWTGFAETAVFVDAAATLDVVLVGTGAEIAAVPGEFVAALAEAGIGVEFMSTPSACRTYNVLLGEGRRIGAALLAV